MPRGTELNEIEIRKIWNLRGKGMSIRNISVKIKRSKGAVENALKRKIDGYVKKRSGAKSKITSRDKRNIIRRAVLRNMTSR